MYSWKKRILKQSNQMYRDNKVQFTNKQYTFVQKQITILVYYLKRLNIINYKLKKQKIVDEKAHFVID